MLNVKIEVIYGDIYAIHTKYPLAGFGETEQLAFEEMERAIDLYIDQLKEGWKKSFDEAAMWKAQTMSRYGHD